MATRAVSPELARALNRMGPGAIPTPAEPTEPPERQPLDPITKPLWRIPRPARNRLMSPFIGERIRIDRWFNRVAALGDQQYEGTLLAVATTTTGSNSDLLILATTDGTVWAISTAQVAYVERITPRGKR